MNPLIDLNFMLLSEGSFWITQGDRGACERPKLSYSD